MRFEWPGSKKKLDPLGVGLVVGSAVLAGAAGVESNVHPKAATEPAPAVGMPSAETSMPTVTHSSDAPPDLTQAKLAELLDHPHNELK